MTKKSKISVLDINDENNIDSIEPPTDEIKTDAEERNDVVEEITNKPQLETIEEHQPKKEETDTQTLAENRF